MGPDICITTLVENTTSSPGLLAEHGLSFWIEYGNRHVLFDTGQSDLIVRNAKALNVDLAQADAIVLSHGHYDHTGGLSAVLGIAPKALIYLHPAAIELKFSRSSSKPCSIGMPDSAKKAIRGRHVIWTESPTQVFDGIGLTGQVPRTNSFEDVGGYFFLDEGCRQPDPLLDDQALFIESSKGLVIVFGCAHAGVVNTLQWISNINRRKHFYAVMGGMHLLNANRIRIANTIEAFKKYDIKKIIPLHCTGQEAIDTMENAFGDKCLCLGAGGKISF